MKDYEFGNLITALRTERGFSQFQLGRLLGVSDKAVSKWENGNAKPRLATCYRLADILGVSLDDLMSTSSSDGSRRPAPVSEIITNKEYERKKAMDQSIVNARNDRSKTKRVELHMRTGMSINDGIANVTALSDRTAQWGMPAVAITDYCTTCAFPMALSRFRRFPQKIIFGCEAFMLPSADSDISSGHHVMLLAMNRQGIVHLNKLVSLSYTDFHHGIPCMPKEIIEENRDGLLIGSSCEGGEIIQLLKENSSWDMILEATAFYDYLEVQPIENEISDLSNQFLRRDWEMQIRNTIRLGKAADAIVVAVSNSRYLDPEDSLSRAILQYNNGLKDSENQPPYYLRTTDEMLSSFSFLGNDLSKEIVIDSTLRIADLVEEQVALYPNAANDFNPLLPEIPDCETTIMDLAMNKARDIYGDNLPLLISERLQREFELISNQNGWPILEIARLAVTRSLQDGYPIGTRGGVGSSLIAFLAGISPVNPLPPHYVCPACHHTIFTSPHRSNCGADLAEKHCPKCKSSMNRDGYSIPIETFMGLDGSRLMDIDLNFSGNIQSTVHQYIRDYFGADHVFKPGIISGLSDRKAKLYSSQYAEDHDLDPNSPEVERASGLISYARTSNGQHPGGLCIVPQNYTVYDFTPIQSPTDNVREAIPTTHYDFNSMHDRLLKMDFLGHDIPTVLKALEDKTGVSPKSIPINDPALLSLFQSPEALHVSASDILSLTGTNGMPEFGSDFVQKMLYEIKPASVEDVIRVSGLSHGTNLWKGNIQNVIVTKSASIYECPSTRDDITNYLTSKGMDIKTAFTISERVRKGKGLLPEMETSMLNFLVPIWYIEACKKIKYMFPRAHTVSYTIQNLQLGWYKLYYPTAFYESYFSICANDLEPSDLSMDIIHLRKAILALRTDIRDKSVEEWFTDEHQYKKTRLSSLLLLLEMNVRGYSLQDNFVSE